MAILCWLRAGDEAATASAKRGMEWLLAQSRGGVFGATQSTAWALRAIVTFFECLPAMIPPSSESKVRLEVDGKSVGATAVFAAPARVGTHCHPGVVEPFGELLTEGEHTVCLSTDSPDGNFLPYTVSVRYSTAQPQLLPGAQCAVALTTALSRSALAEGEVADVVVRLVNITDALLPMVCAIVGVPGGLVVQADPLDDLVTRTEALSCYTIRGREVVLYLAGLEAAQTLELTVEVLAATPGSYSGPASRAYLYYTDETKSWAAPLQAKVSLGDGSYVHVD